MCKQTDSVRVFSMTNVKVLILLRKESYDLGLWA